METKGSIEIRVSGKKGQLDLSPETIDIKDILEVLQRIDQLLFSGNKKDRPIVNYNIGEGSVRHTFTTSLQYILTFNTIIGQISDLQSIDFLDNPTASAIEVFQDIATKKDWQIEMKTSLNNTYYLKIDRFSNLYRQSSAWVDAELYLYGKVMDIGGKGKANLHLNTEEYCSLIINSTQEYLKNIPDNILYKSFGVRAKGRQMLTTGEIDKNSLILEEILNYQPEYQEDYLSKLRKKATENWLGTIDTEIWLRNLRNGYGV